MLLFFPALEEYCSETIAVKRHQLRILGSGCGLAVILGAAVGGEILLLILAWPIFRWTRSRALRTALPDLEA